MNWNDVELRVFSTDRSAATGTFTTPGGDVQMLRVENGRLLADPLAGKVRWRITPGTRRSLH
jgi:hypothetical protein